jgi:hypothetical protein
MSNDRSKASIPTLLEQAVEQYERGHFEGALLHALTLIAGTSRRMFTDRNADKDPDAFKKYLAKRLSEAGISNIAVKRDLTGPRQRPHLLPEHMRYRRDGSAKEPPETPAAVIYHLYRCNLAHEASLPEGVEIVHSESPGVRFEVTRYAITTGMIGLLLAIVRADPVNAKLFGETSFQLMPRDPNFDRKAFDRATLLECGMTAGKCCHLYEYLEGIATEIGLGIFETGSDTDISNAIASRAIARNDHLSWLANTVPAGECSTPQPFFDRRTNALTSRGIRYLRDLAAQYEATEYP